MKNFLRISIFAFILLTDFVTFAQPGDESDDGDLEGLDPAPAPINTKLIYLAIAGIIFSIYAIKKYRKTEM